MVVKKRETRMDLTINGHKTAPFETKPSKRLTDGQLALLALMKKKIKSGKTITKQEIIDIYAFHVQRTPYQRYTIQKYNKARQVFEYGLEDMSDWSMEQYASQWLVQNLGRLILKEKLIAIPVKMIEL